MTTEHGNKLIAEFMGVKIGEDKYSWRPGVIQPLEENHLNYHESWGWLMPVVEKIIKIECDDCSHPDCKPETCEHPKDTYWLRTFGMLSDEGEFMVRFNRHPLFISDSLITATFEAVTFFLENFQFKTN